MKRKFTPPAKILSELNQRVKTALKEDELKNTAREGMDIALCAYEPESKTLKFSSANLTLYCHYGNGMVEHKTDKEAIGGFTPNDYLFSETEVSLNNCKTFYLSSDGYADQFGGPKNKKYSKAAFREFLTGISDLSMEEQKRELARNHNEWKKENEQTDDILVMGFRV